MDTKGTFQLYRSDTVLLSDTEYYKYIFKKTEKIVCAVFYILEHTDRGQLSRAADTLAASGDAALRAALATLSRPRYAAGDELLALASSLTALGSHLRVAQASGLFEDALADMLALEIDTVLRSLKPYLAAEKRHAPDLSEFGVMERPFPSAQSTYREPVGTRSAPRAPAAPGALREGSVTGSSGSRSARQTAIKDILASKGQSTIKDISDALPDCSEKTVQRELTAMIVEGIVKKEGERRWSRYELSDMHA